MEPEARLSYEVDLGPPGWQRSSGEIGFPRKRAYCSGPARARRGGLWGAWSGTPFEVGLGLAEAAVEP